MSGKYKRPKSKGLSIGGSFTPILTQVHDSAAFRELTGNAAKLYTYVVRAARTVALKLGSGTESGVEFDYTYSEAKKRGFSESTFKRAIKDLWDHGFISVVVVGGRIASVNGGRMSSRYKLCGNWQSYGEQWDDRTQYEPNPWPPPPTEPSVSDVSKW